MDILLKMNKDHHNNLHKSLFTSFKICFIDSFIAFGRRICDSKSQFYLNAMLYKAKRPSTSKFASAFILPPLLSNGHAYLFSTLHG